MGCCWGVRQGSYLQWVVVGVFDRVVTCSGLLFGCLAGSLPVVGCCWGVWQCSYL